MRGNVEELEMRLAMAMAADVSALGVAAASHAQRGIGRRGRGFEGGPCVGSQETIQREGERCLGVCKRKMEWVRI